MIICNYALAQPPKFTIVGNRSQTEVDSSYLIETEPQVFFWGVGK